jgi:hypothetical protein
MNPWGTAMDFSPMPKTMEPAEIRSRFHSTDEINRWYRSFFMG